MARRRGWEPFGIDESHEATEHARNHFGLDPWVGEFESFVASGETFDLVTGWDIIEHSRDPVGLMRSARSRLTADGVVARPSWTKPAVARVVLKKQPWPLRLCWPMPAHDHPHKCLKGFNGYSRRL